MASRVLPGPPQSTSPMSPLSRCASSQDSRLLPVPAAHLAPSLGQIPTPLGTLPRPPWRGQSGLSFTCSPRPPAFGAAAVAGRHPVELHRRKCGVPPGLTVYCAVAPGAGPARSGRPGDTGGRKEGGGQCGPPAVASCGSGGCCPGPRWRPSPSASPGALSLLLLQGRGNAWRAAFSCPPTRYPSPCRLPYGPPAPLFPASSPPHSLCRHHRTLISSGPKLSAAPPPRPRFLSLFPHLAPGSCRFSPLLDSDFFSRTGLGIIPRGRPARSLPTAGAQCVCVPSGDE